MISNPIPSYASKSVILFLGAITIPLVFLLIFILPTKKIDAKIEAEINRAQLRLETQEKLAPLYKGIEDKMKRISKKIVVPKKSPVPKSQLNSVNKTISDIARKSGVTFVSAYPESAESNALYIIALRGNFLNFQNFLMDLGAVQFIESIDELKVTPGAGRLDFNLKVRIVIS